MSDAKKTPTCKICCACPNERRARDECVIFNGFEKCVSQIDKFYACLLTEGFSQEQVSSLRDKANKF
jgi:cytochrome c oxidase assembly protein subunit 17